MGRWVDQNQDRGLCYCIDFYLVEILFQNGSFKIPAVFLSLHGFGIKSRKKRKNELTV